MTSGSGHLFRSSRVVRRAFVIAALFYASLTGGAAVSAINAPPAHAISEFYCGAFATYGPTIWAYGIQGSTECSYYGSVYYIESTCITYSLNSWGSPMYTDPGSGVRGTSCDALDSGGIETANGYLRPGCAYYWVDTTYFYNGANYDYFSYQSGSNHYVCH